MLWASPSLSEVTPFQPGRPPDIESSRDSGCRHELGRLVQFCACRNPTSAICRVMRFSLCAWDWISFQTEFGGELIVSSERFQLVPRGVFDLDAVAPALLLADMFDLAGIENAGRAFGRRRRFQIPRDLADFF